MHEPAETIHHDELDGWKVDVFNDWDAGSPAEWDQLGTLVAFDRLWREYRFTERVSNGTEDDAIARGGTRLLERFLRLTEGWEVVPFNFEERGAQARLYSIDYDTDNPSGFIYVDREDIVKEYGNDSAESRARAREVLNGELQEWGQYVEGDVWGYVVSGPNGEGDSCWGFYGFEYALTEAREALEYAIKTEREERVKVERSIAI